MKVPRRLLWGAFKTNSIRKATSTQRAAYNLLNSLPEDVVPVERLKEKAGKDSAPTFWKPTLRRFKLARHLDATPAQTR